MTRPDDLDYDPPDPSHKRKEPPCQCDGAQVGPCPGPFNCPYSGYMLEEEDENEHNLEPDRESGVPAGSNPLAD